MGNRTENLNNIYNVVFPETDIENAPLDKLSEIDDEGTRERLLIKSVKSISEKYISWKKKDNRNCYSGSLFNYVICHYSKLKICKLLSY